MILNRAKLLTIFAILVTLTACESTREYDFSIPYLYRAEADKKSNSGVSTSTEIKSDGFIPPHMVFNKYKVISINSAEIEIDNRYEMSQMPPHVEHYFPISLETTMKNLIDSKLLALGESNRLKVIIDDLSVVKEKLPEGTGFVGSFRKHPTHILKSRVVMRFELVDEKRPEVILGHSTLVAKRDRPVYGNMSVADKEHAYYQLTEALVDDVYKGFADTVQKYFGMEEF